jgi:hypothetical protein
VAASPPTPPLPSEPLWVAELTPRPRGKALETMRVVPLPSPEELEDAPAPAIGSRRLGRVAALAVGVAAMTLGLGPHQPQAASAAPPVAASVSGVGVAPWDLPAQVSATVASLRASADPLLHQSAPPQDDAVIEHAARSKPRPSAHRRPHG